MKEEHQAVSKANELLLTLKGKIQSHERISSTNGDFYSNLIVVPAKDEYSHPKRFAVNASAPLATDGTELTVVCEVRPSNNKKDGKFFHNINLWKDEGGAA
jgi:hypothetical protein